MVGPPKTGNTINNKNDRRAPDIAITLDLAHRHTNHGLPVKVQRSIQSPRGQM